MRKRHCWIGLFLAIGLSIAGVVFCADSGSKEAKRLTQEIGQSLPLGVASKAVQEWLDARGFVTWSVQVDDHTQVATLKAHAYREYFWDWNGHLEVYFQFGPKGLERFGMWWSPRPL
jgi:hypothetical protein